VGVARSGGGGPAAGAARLGGVLRELRRLFLRSLLEFGIFWVWFSFAARDPNGEIWVGSIGDSLRYS